MFKEYTIKRMEESRIVTQCGEIFEVSDIRGYSINKENLDANVNQWTHELLFKWGKKAKRYGWMSIHTNNLVIFKDAKLATEF